MTPPGGVESFLPLVASLARHVRLRTGCILDRQDLVSIGVHELLKVWTTEPPCQTYLRTCIKGAMLDAIRRAEHSRASASAVQARHPIHLEETSPIPAPGEDEALVFDVRAALDRLPAQLRMLASEHWLSGASWKALAARTGHSEVWVWYRLLEARTRLARALAAYVVT